jgi:hypothetical protein
MYIAQDIPELVAPRYICSRWYRRYGKWAVLTFRSRISGVTPNDWQASADKAGAIKMAPSSLNVMRPLSKRESKFGIKRIPLKASNRSDAFETAQGFT